MPLALRATEPGVRFCHQALFYSGDRELVAALEHFVREGLSAKDKVLVVLSGPKIETLRASLGDEAAGVSFADMDEVGSNPARIIPLWSSYLADLAPGQRARGVGEPVGPTRRPSELAECQVHESLLNVAFAGVPGFWLLCPYDTSALDDSVLQEALQSHGFVSSCGQSAVPNRRYAPDQADRALWRDDLVPAPAEAQHLEIDATCIASARKVVQARAYELGLSERLAGDFALAVHEVVANSLKHGTGRGDMSMWESNESIVCEVRDGGRFAAPLAGRQRPIETGDTGRGLWMANQLCDLVQIRAGQGGTVVRLHMHKPSAGS